MGAELYIKPLKRTKEREEFYKKWTFEQLCDAKYYEELRDDFEDDIEFYIYAEEDRELERFENERDVHKLDKYWRGFYWLSIRNLLGVDFDYNDVKTQFQIEKDTLEELEKTTHDRDELLFILTKASACRYVERQMEIVSNESVHLQVLQEYRNLELKEEFFNAQTDEWYLFGQDVYDVLSVLNYSIYSDFFFPLERKHFEKMYKELKDGMVGQLNLESIKKLDFENYMWFVFYVY